MHRIITAAALTAALTAALAAPAAAGTAYTAMAPLARYMTDSKTEEAALARSAAPPSISDHAEVVALGAHGYETVAKGGNGFVCIVQRAWANSVGADGFWNPRLRAPSCFNAAAAQSVLPVYLERTRWVLAGASRTEIDARTRAAVAAGHYAAPATGAMCFMMSKRGYLGDDAGGPWHPHLMFFVPADAGGPESWGANLAGVPLIGSTDPVEPVTTFFVPVGKWSDGTPDGGTRATQMHMQ